MKGKFKLAIALTGVVSMLLMLAQFLGFIPDRDQLVQQNRATLAESIAIHATSMMLANRMDLLERDLPYFAERNDDLESIGLRRADGTLIVSFGDHEKHWQAGTGETSTTDQLKVPIWDGKVKWGELEMHFARLHAPGIEGIVQNPTVRMLTLIGAASLLAFTVLLSLALRTAPGSGTVPSRVRTALDTLAEGLLILDEKGEIALANSAFSSYLGVTPESLIGRDANELDWRDAQGNPTRSETHPWMRAIASGETQKSIPLQLNTRDGGTLTLQVSSSPIIGENGRAHGSLVSFDDISELRKKEVELEKSKAEAEAANQAKSAFLANMSHEIRTPMNAILGFTEILKRGYVHNQQESLRYLNIINSSGKSLLDLINDILDLSKVESGKMEMEISRIQPYHIVYEAIQVLALRASEKGIRLDYDVVGRIPEYIHSDPTRLRQIIINIVGNAIKFTERGGVHVTCRFDDNGETPRIVFDVSDTGIGMTEEQLRNIFNPFVQADSSTTRRFGGTGLGLTISKKFAENLGGGIEVSSEEGRGSTFSISIATGDLDGVKFIAPDEIELAADLGDDGFVTRWVLPKARVLVVDDGPENRELVKLLLSDAGVAVDEAENGHEGLEKATSGGYDVILMDVQMPEMDGFTAARKMREAGLETPIIALTANAMKGFEQECLAVGYSGYFSKPIDVDRFMDLMGELLGGKQVSVPRDAVEPQGAGADTSEAAAGTTDETPAQPRKPDDDSDAPIYPELPVESPKIAAIAEKFIGRLRDQLVEMERAWEKRDLDQLAGLAHWLKGAGGTVGFKVFHDPAVKLEKAAKAGQEADIPPLLETIGGLTARLAIRGKEHEAATDAAKSAPESDKGKSALPSGPLRSRLADDPRFHRTIGSFVEKLRDKGREMDTLCEREDYEGLAALAHWLKGSAGTIGFDVFTEPARELEQLARAGEKAALEAAIDRLLEMIELAEAPRTEQEKALTQ